MRVLVTAASKYGSTDEIAEAIGRVLTERGLEVTIAPVADVSSVEGFDAVILGSAVYTGHWLASAKDFVSRWSGELASKRVWLFSSGPVGDPSRKMVQRMGADPLDIPAVTRATNAVEHRVFAGKLDKAHLGIASKLALLVIRGVDGDFREWDSIKEWAAGIAVALETSSPSVKHG